MLFYNNNKYEFCDCANSMMIPLYKYFVIQCPKKVLLLNNMPDKFRIIILDGKLLHIYIHTCDDKIKYQTISIPNVDKIDDIVGVSNSNIIYCIGTNKNKSVTICCIDIYCVDIDDNIDLIVEVVSGVTVLNVVCYKIINFDHIVFLFNDKQIMDVKLWFEIQDVMSYNFDEIATSDNNSCFNIEYEDILCTTLYNIAYKTDMANIDVDKDTIIDLSMEEKKRLISCVHAIYINNDKIVYKRVHEIGRNIFSKQNEYDILDRSCVPNKEKKINNKLSVLKSTNNTNYYSCAYGDVNHNKIISEINYDTINLHFFEYHKTPHTITFNEGNYDICIIGDKCYYRKWNVCVYHFLGQKYQDVIRSTIMCNKCLGVFRMPKYLLYIIFDHVIVNHYN